MGKNLSGPSWEGVRWNAWRDEAFHRKLAKIGREVYTGWKTVRIITIYLNRTMKSQSMTGAWHRSKRASWNYHPFPSAGTLNALDAPTWETSYIFRSA